MTIDHCYTVTLLTDTCLKPPHGPSFILSLTAHIIVHS